MDGTLPPPAAPPAQRPAWPMVFGIVGLLFGGGALLQGLGAIALYVFRGPFVRMTTPHVEAEMLAYYDRWAPFFVGGAVASLGLAALLGAASIALLRLRRWGARGMRMWAVGKLIFAGSSLFWSLPMQRESFAMQAGAFGAPGGGVPDPVAAQMTQFMELLAPVSVALGIVWVVLFPLVVLIWFARRAVRETVAGWR